MIRQIRQITYHYLFTLSWVCIVYITKTRADEAGNLNAGLVCCVFAGLNAECCRSFTGVFPYQDLPVIIIFITLQGSIMRCSTS